LDVIPYITGEGNPHADAGFEFYKRDVVVRQGLGADGQKSYICPAYSFEPGRRDFVQDWINKNRGSADAKYLDTLRLQNRIFLWVKDVTNISPQKAPTVLMDQSYGSEAHPNF